MNPSWTDSRKDTGTKFCPLRGSVNSATKFCPFFTEKCFSQLPDLQSLTHLFTPTFSERPPGVGTSWTASEIEALAGETGNGTWKHVSYGKLAPQKLKEDINEHRLAAA